MGVCIECQRVCKRGANVQNARVSLVVCAIVYAYKRLFANARKFKSASIYVSVGLVRTDYEYFALKRLMTIVNDFMVFCMRT